jgi:hypothetical protein
MPTEPPTLRVAFVLDANGRPVNDGEGNFSIKMWIEGAPEATLSVQYTLDETYPERVREILLPMDGFEETTTTYGDYDIAAKVNTPDGSLRLKVNVARGLYDSHKSSLTPEIKAAIRQIHDN